MKHFLGNKPSKLKFLCFFESALMGITLPCFLYCVPSFCQVELLQPHSFVCWNLRPVICFWGHIHSLMWDSNKLRVKGFFYMLLKQDFRVLSRPEMLSFICVWRLPEVCWRYVWQQECSSTDPFLRLRHHWWRKSRGKMWKWKFGVHVPDTSLFLIFQSLSDSGLFSTVFPSIKKWISFWGF